MRGQQLIAIGAAAFMAGGVTFGIGLSGHSQCDTALGQMGQAISSRAQASCSIDGLLYIGGGVGALAGATMVVAGIVTASDKRRQPPRPGWYPDPAQPGMLRWWDGYRWTEARHPGRPPQ